MSDTKPKHTPGPWKAHAEGGTVFGELGLLIASTPDRNAENARLIAAAPELLEALECLLSLGASEHFGKWDDWEEVKAAKAAIAKAQGER